MVKCLIYQFSPIYFPLSVIFFILNKAIYSFLGLNMPYLHITLTEFALVFTKKITIAVYTCLMSVNYFGVTSLCIPNNTICDTHPNGLILTNHSFKRQIHWIFWYMIIVYKILYKIIKIYTNSLDFLWKSTFLKTSFFKLSFHIFFKWNCGLFFLCLFD